jgi:hypothetical protein
MQSQENNNNAGMSCKYVDMLIPRDCNTALTPEAWVEVWRGVGVEVWGCWSLSCVCV